MTQSCSGKKKRNGQRVWTAEKRQEFCCEVKGKDTDKVVVGGGVCMRGKKNCLFPLTGLHGGSLNIPYRLGGRDKLT